MHLSLPVEDATGERSTRASRLAVAAERAAATGRRCALGRRPVLRPHLLRLRQGGLPATAPRQARPGQAILLDADQLESVNSGAREFALSPTPESEAEVSAVNVDRQRGLQLGDRGPEPGETSISPRHQRGRGPEVTFPETCPPGAIQRCSCPSCSRPRPVPTQGPHLLPLFPLPSRLP